MMLTKANKLKSGFGYLPQTRDLKVQLFKSRGARIYTITCCNANRLQKDVKYVLGIESSCDDTAAAIVTSHGTVLGEAIATQADIHAKWGGVVPSLAREAHESAIERVIAETFAQAGLEPSDLDAVAVTLGPGLSLCLRVGVVAAHKLCAVHHVPLVHIHHMEAHALVVRLSGAAALATQASSNSLELEQNTNIDLPSPLPIADEAKSFSFDVQATPTFPFLCLLVSGGHNLLVLVKGVGQYIQIGTTLDDAIGEAYDKVARLLSLDLRPSGGAALEATARSGDPKAFRFKRPMLQHANCDFSFAGLKTQVRMAVESSLPPVEDSAYASCAANIAASFQATAVEHLADRVARAISWARELEPQLSTLVVAGGVAANLVIRQRLAEVAEAGGLKLVVPPLRWCTDNGVMVAWAGIERLAGGYAEPPPLVPPGPEDWIDLKPRWPLTSLMHPRAMLDYSAKSARRSKMSKSLTELSSKT